MLKKIPKFVRQNRGIDKRVGDAWRKPRGIDNKQRMQRAGQGAIPKIGYRTPRKERHLHPRGLPEKLVHSMAELEAIGKGVLVRFASTVGARKRRQLLVKAKAAGLRVLNA